MPAEKKKTPEVLLFTDGACSGNPGPGGWAYILRHPETGRETSAQGSEADTTNNRMELTAAVQGLQQLKRPTCVELVTIVFTLVQVFQTGCQNGKSRAGKEKNGDALWL